MYRLTLKNQYVSAAKGDGYFDFISLAVGYTNNDYVTMIDLRVVILGLGFALHRIHRKHT